jgi:UDP-glucose 4-epimerase
MKKKKQKPILNGLNKKPTVLITGVAGLFGANYSRYLLDRGFSVVGIDDLSGGYKEFLPEEESHFKLYPYKIREVQLDELITEYKIEYVYHFAAYAAAGLSPFVREFNYENNIMESARLINASIRNNIKKFIFTSSMEVYGDGNPPFREGDVMEAITETPYGVAKRAVELDLESAYQYHGLDYAIIRPHNVHGIYQNIWDKYRNVIGIFIRQAIAGEDITVFGDGEQKRAFSDIDCYMEPLLKLMTEHSRKDQADFTRNFPIWNIGADKESTVIEVATLVQKVAKENNINVNIVHKEQRTEVLWAYCEHEKAKNDLGFKDTTDLENLVRKMFVWALTQTPKKIKKLPYEVDKNIYEYWK